LCLICDLGNPAKGVNSATGNQELHLKPLLLFSVALLLGHSTFHVRADDGCKILLCLAGDWQRIAPCEPEVRAALNRVALGRPLPVCTMAGAGNYAAEGFNPYNPCPAGTTALSAGRLALVGTPSMAGSFVGGTPGTFYTGIGDGSAGAHCGPDGCVDPTQGGTLPEICAGTYLGDMTYFNGNGESYTQTIYSIFDHIVPMDPVANPWYVDVFMRGTLYRRVRW
jgi:hypothetical protein